MAVRLVLEILRPEHARVEVTLAKKLSLGWNPAANPRVEFSAEPLTTERCVLELEEEKLYASSPIAFGIFGWMNAKPERLRLHPGMHLPSLLPGRVLSITNHSGTHSATREYFTEQFRATGALELWNHPRLLEPDHSLETLDRTATLWIEACVDEWLSALYEWGLPQKIHVPHRIVRSIHTMPAAWLQLWPGPNTVWNDSEEALVHTQQRAYYTVMREQDSFLDVFSMFAFGSPLLDLGTTWSTFSWDSDVPVPWLNTLFAAFLHKHYKRSEPSPWKPLLALWERGCWPMLSKGPELQVCVPVRSEIAKIENWPGLPRDKYPAPQRSQIDWFLGHSPPPARVDWQRLNRDPNSGDLFGPCAPPELPVTD